MSIEQQISIAAKLYEMRNAARSLLGSGYAERMAELRELIEIARQRLGLTELAAAQKLCENPEAGAFDVLFIMAAAVEMIEPTQVQHSGPQHDG